MARTDGRAIPLDNPENNVNRAQNAVEQPTEVRYSFRDVPVPTYEQLIEKPNIPVVDIRRERSGSFKQEREAFLSSERAQQLYSAPVTNRDTGESIFITPATIKHSFSNQMPDKIGMAEHLPEIIESAVLTHAAQSRNAPRDSTTGVYTLFGAAETSEGVQPVKLTVKEYNINGQPLPQNIVDYLGTGIQPETFASAYDGKVLVLEGIEKEGPSSSAGSAAAKMPVAEVYPSGPSSKGPSSSETTDAAKRAAVSYPSGPSKISVKDLLALVKGDAARYVRIETQNRPAARAEHPGLVRDEKTDAAGLTHRQERALDVLGQVLGVEVRFADALTDARGRKAQARYADGVITLALDAADPFMATAVHETVHRIRELSKGDYDHLKNFVIDNMNSHNYSDDQSAKARLYGEDADLTEETVADAFGRILGDEATLRQFVKENSTAAQRFFDALNDLLDRVKAALRGEKAQARTFPSEQREIYSDLEAQLETMLALYSGALQSARDSEGTANTGANHSFNGYDEETGRGIYQANFPKGTPKAAKAQHILELIQNVWSKKPLRLVYTDEDGNTQTITAQYDPTYYSDQNIPTDASKLMGGNKHGNALEKRVTLDLADDYYQILAEARYNGHLDEKGKTTATHKNVEEWKYFANDILFQEHDGGNLTPYQVSVNIKKTPDGHFVYSYNADAEPQNIKGPSTRRTLHADVNQAAEADKANARSSVSIRDNAQKNKPKYSMPDRYDLPAVDRFVQPTAQPPSLYDMAYAMYTGESDRLYRQLRLQQAARGGPMPPAPETARDDRERMNADPRADGEAVTPRVDGKAEPEEKLPVDYLSILDLGYGPVSASRLRDLLMMGEVERYVEDGRIRFRRAKDTE